MTAAAAAAAVAAHIVVVAPERTEAAHTGARIEAAALHTGHRTVTHIASAAAALVLDHSRTGAVAHMAHRIAAAVAHNHTALAEDKAAEVHSLVVRLVHNMRRGLQEERVHRSRTKLMVASHTHRPTARRMRRRNLAPSPGWGTEPRLPRPAAERCVP